MDQFNKYYYGEAEHQCVHRPRKPRRSGILLYPGDVSLPFMSVLFYDFALFSKPNYIRSILTDIGVIF